ncbi:MAG: hypothetical protein ACRYGR_10160, partial [Janthinobacterium lividum]
ITKTATRSPNNSKITVYNLAPATRALFEKPDSKCEFYAGYAQDAGPVLMHSGNIVFAYTRREGPSFATEIQLSDGHVEARDGMVSIQIPVNGLSTNALTQIASQMGLSLYMDKGILSRTWAHGFSFYGPGRIALTKICSATGLEWSIQNGFLQIINRGGVTQRKGFVLKSTTGMILSPERLREGSRESATIVGSTNDQKLLANKVLIGQRLQFNGWRVRSLLLPSPGPGDSIVLDSLDVQGQFRIQKVIHRGDSYGGNWESEFDLLKPNDYAVAVAQYDQKVAHRAAAAAKRAARAAKKAAKARGSI